MFQALRTDQQLGYHVTVSQKETNGVHGVSLIIMSPEHSPVVLQERILEFLDSFIVDQFDEKLFEDFRDGTIARKKQGYTNFAEEARSLFERLRLFSLSPHRGIVWDLREKQIEYLELLTFEETRVCFIELFSPPLPPQQLDWL